MYYYVSGKAVYITQGKVVLDAGGIGYEISVSSFTEGRVRAAGDGIVRLYTAFIVREDAQELYGFFTLDEKRMFELLVSVSGVGPRAAMSILSTLPVDKLVLCIMSDDAKSISAAQNIGIRTAQKIILEIKDKLKKEGFSVGSEALETTEKVDKGALDEALLALTSLGYTRSEALTALKGAPSGAGVEDLIRHALKNLTK